jgi:hypothetical protein
MSTDPNRTRTKFFKAATTGLTGPHYGGLVYVPGSEHALGINDPFDSDPQGWCTAGLYVTSHRRVAARWGPVVLQVAVPHEAPLVKTTQRHKPPGVPSGVDSGSYAKYRTTKLAVSGIVGVVGFSWSSTERSRYDAERKLGDLNDTLRKLGRPPVRLHEGPPLERLRHDGYCLWGVETVPERDLLQRFTVTLDANLFRDLAPKDWQDQVQRTVERAVGSLSYVQTVGNANSWTDVREPLG